jgi:diguanylate cyclase (GGDEF)-like protein
MSFHSLAFFGIPKDENLSPSLIKRVNTERARVYFGNTTGNIASLYAGTVLGMSALYGLDVALWKIGAWGFVLFFLGWVMWKYEKNVLTQALDHDTLYTHVARRIGLGFLIGVVWGFFALIVPVDSHLGFALSFIAVSTLVIIGMLSFSVIPTQFFIHTLGAMSPLVCRLVYAYLQTNEVFYITLFAIVLVWQVVLLLKARTNSITAIRAIVLNEKLKDEIGRYAKAQKHIEYLAYHDHLTGAWNRRYFEGFLEDLLLKASLKHEQVGILAIDINRLKPVNDQYGHHYGDQLLVAFTKHLKEHLPSDALLARVGGDEFAIVLPHVSSLEALQHQGEHLKQRLETTYMLFDAPFSSSASVGYALFPQDGTDMETLLATADGRMYENKKGE